MTETVSGTARSRFLKRALPVANRAGVKAIPHLPSAVKRLLSGGRAITIDGNTLDPSIQMMLAAQRAVGMSSLAVTGDPIATRRQNREATDSLDEANIHVAQISPLEI
ncbi:MAG: alpha/beta hydrolase, partial [Mycolicibacterium aromaticivorans]|nr:alpha/beta hydrolase [Mycolicibacterium aromaticivorans]